LEILFNKRSRAISARIGQALEIATFRALLSQPTLSFLGNFKDLDAHDDSTLYSKNEPPTFLSGKTTPSGKELDFILQLDQAGFVGVELKNVREWFYPARPEVRDHLLKCCALDVVPVLIVRRRHISVFNVLNPCGVITHETYNQLYPETERALALEVSHKDLLGYHDIRVGNVPDQRLTNFITTNLPKLLPAFRKRFDHFKDLLGQYANQRISYEEFFAKVRERTGQSTEKPKPSTAGRSFDVKKLEEALAAIEKKFGNKKLPEPTSISKPKQPPRRRKTTPVTKPKTSS
jgi:hypothetical protein